ncbi:MAG TPA: phasin family protein [Steroidobacteraceae bacterium]|nr:phasin family protein [Steroidobacteraceae bacterium]
MAINTLDMSTLFDAFRNSFAPVLRAQQEGIAAAERLARYQFAVAGDYLDWSIAQAKTGVAAKTPDELTAKLSELNTRFSELLKKRSQEFATIASETQGAVTQWFGDAVKQAA